MVFGKFRVVGYFGQRIGKEKTIQENTPVLDVLSRCLLVLLFLVSEICMPGILFYFSLC